MKNKTVLVFGVTGLVGEELLKQLVADKFYDKIYAFSRQPIQQKSKKLENIITDFSDLSKIEKYAQEASVCFYCIGSTIKKAQTQDKFKEIEYGLTVKVAQLCKNNGVERFLYISSIGADLNSSNFYLRTKGEIELALQQQYFPILSVVRPSMLLGKRQEKRFGESVGKALMIVLGPLVALTMPNYRAIQATTVAKALLKISKNGKKLHFYSNNELFAIAKDKFQF